jgi:hypothetical protein
MNDKELIQQLGGPSAVSKMLGYSKGGCQRVYNWLDRGIPAAVKIQFPHLFLSRKGAAKKLSPPK